MYERAEEKAKELQVTHELLDEWKRRGDELLYSMIPESIAESLRRGKEPVDTCEVRLQSFLVSCVNLCLKFDRNFPNLSIFPQNILVTLFMFAKLGF